MRPLRLAILFALLLRLFASLAQSDLDAIRRATVFIYQAQSVANDLIVKCIASGTIISADGLIITRAHSVLTSSICDGDNLIVSLNVDLSEPPVPKYRADIAAVDESLDLAILRVTRELDGRLIAAGSLPALPFSPIGDAAEVDIDDSLLVAGFRDLGNQAVSVARGTVTAFIAEPVGGERAWFKTRAELPGVMAGGGAYNSAGELIGIPTGAQYGPLGADASCRIIEDSNRDGLINSNDHCVPTGDFVSTIRPISLAGSLIRGASLGLKVELHSATDQLSPPQSPPTVSRLFFSPSVVDGLPSTVVGAIPANSNSLFLFFDFANMTADTVYELRVMRDGVPDGAYSLPPVHWSGGRRGLWYIGSRDQPWANGAWQFTVLLNGIAAGSQQIIIGGPAAITPAFSNIIFGLLASGGNLIGNGYILPTGSIAYARFLFANLREGMPWSAIWSFQGGEVARTNDIWRRGGSGSDVVSLQPSGGLLPGNYRLDLYLDGALSATSDFVVAGLPGGPLPAIFSRGRYSAASDPFSARQALPSSAFPKGIPALFALFDWQRIAAGTDWTLRWLVDDRTFYQRRAPWQTVDAGADFMLSVANPPEGAYKLQLLVNNLQILEIEGAVGIGQLPIDRTAGFTGLRLGGHARDAATGAGIPSVTLLLISQDYTAAEFEWSEEQVVASATSDRNGDFQFDLPLQTETDYSIVVAADGYLPLSADGFRFDAGQRSASLNIELSRG